MAETTSSQQQQSGKPGTACLGCRRRKLKCSREQEGCSNCFKAELPCVYPAPETGVKRKRGPYNKDKPPRERHLEDLVKYLEPKVAEAENASSSGQAKSGSSDELLRDDQPLLGITDSSSPYSSGLRANLKPSNSEDLVKDALIALTKSSVEDRESGGENGTTHASLATQKPTQSGVLGTHPPARRILEYWHLFETRVDPILKIIHCPSFAKKLFHVIDSPQDAGPVTESLLFSIYHAAVSTCTAREARRRFGEHRDALLQRYGRTIEATLADNYSIPVLESLQALVIYAISIRRDDSTTNIRALFSLAVRMAQMIGLHEDPGPSFTTFEAEMRRRLWWHIYGLESRGAEEGGTRQNSIMGGDHVRLPANLNDIDLEPDMKEAVHPRFGITDVTFVLLRFEMFRLVHILGNIKKKHQPEGQQQGSNTTKSEQGRALQEGKLRFETHYLRHLHESRSYDWLCIGWIHAMLIKCRLIVEHPFGQVPTKIMPPQERYDLLQASVSIIRMTDAVTRNKRIADWHWYFRGWVQWHSIGVVIAELGGNKNQQFVNAAWAVLDPILADWDKVYHWKRDEPAWEHVNTMIERARQMRKQVHVSAATQQNPPPAAKQLPMSDPSVAQKNGYDPSSLDVGNWQADWTGLGSTQMLEPISSTSLGQQQTSIPHTNVPFTTGCAPSMPGLGGEFGWIEGLDDIDFSAFEGVFGDAAWDFSSPSTDVNFENFGQGWEP